MPIQLRKDPSCYLRSDKFPAPKFPEHAGDKEANTDNGAWNDLSNIFGSMPDKAPVVKLADRVPKPQTTAEKKVDADAKIAAAAAKLKETEDKLKAAQAKLAQKMEKPEEIQPIEIEEPVEDEEELEDEDDTPLESKKNNMNEYAPQFLLILMSFVTQQVLQPADADNLTFSSWLQFAGVVTLMTSVVSSASAEGLRAATFERLAAAAALRLAVAGGGYFPAGAYDGLYLLGDAGTLVAALVMIALLRTTYKSTCVADLDSYDRSLVAMICVAFASSMHGDLGDSMLLDIMWMTALCVESVALFPQMYAMLHGCKSMPLLSVVAFIASRACSFGFWFDACSELRTVVAVCVMSLYSMQLLLACSLATGRFLSVKREVGITE